MSTLVVVDDEPAFANFVAKVAATAKFEAKVVESAAALAAETAWPSVLVIDLQMPDTDGIELLRKMREWHCPSKVVLVSGVDARVLDSAFRLGAEIGLAMAGKVSKPVRAPELRQLLSALHDHSDVPTPEALSSAIDQDRLFLHFQPKIDIRTRTMVGVEALVRWKDELGRVRPPDMFVPLAESSGLIDKLTAWVVQSALGQAAAWRRRGLDLGLAINLSARNIHDRQLPDRLAAQCAAAGVETGSITLELTETASTQDFTTLLEVLGRFRLKGFHLSIDDFGTGYSSVAQLLRLPFSELKIDKSFVGQMVDERDAKVIAKTLVDMAHNLGMTTVAEGIESHAALKILSDWGCDIAQGYLFSKPVPAETIEAMAAAPPWSI